MWVTNIFSRKGGRQIRLSNTKESNCNSWEFMLSAFNI